MTFDETVAAPRRGSRFPQRFLPNALTVPRRPVRAIAVGWLLAFAGSMALAFLVGKLLPDAPRPQFHVDVLTAILALVIFSPVVETLVMGTVLLLLLRFVSPGVAILLSAIGWGAVHSSLALAWGLVIWWPFLIFSALFVTWRPRSLPLAFAIPACAHALQNLVPAMLVAKGLAG